MQKNECFVVLIEVKVLWQLSATLVKNVISRDEFSEHLDIRAYLERVSYVDILRDSNLDATIQDIQRELIVAAFFHLSDDSQFLVETGSEQLRSHPFVIYVIHIIKLIILFRVEIIDFSPRNNFFKYLIPGHLVVESQKNKKGLVHAQNGGCFHLHVFIYRKF